MVRSTIIFVIILHLLLFCAEVRAHAKTSEKKTEERKDIEIVDEVDILVRQTDTSEYLKNRISSAVATYKKVNQMANYISSLSEMFSKRDIHLPVGIKSTKKDYMVCIEQVYNDTVSASKDVYIKAVCVVPLSGEGKHLVFEGDVLLEGDKGIGTKGYLKLLEMVEVPMGKESSVFFCDGTMIQIGCEGFERVEAKLAFAVKSKDIYTVDKKGQREGRLLLKTETTFEDFDDFTLSMSIDKTVKIEGLDDFSINLQSAIWDQSITTTPSTVEFPMGYFVEGEEGVNIKAWRGLSISDATIVLPSYLSNYQAESKRDMILRLKNVLIDGEGMTCRCSAKNIIDSGAFSGEEWAMSVTGFELAMMKGEVEGAGFNGKINIPPFGKSSLLDYEAIYNKAENTFTFLANLGRKQEFPILFGDMTFHETSTIEIKIKEDGVYPTIIANGQLSMNIPMGKDTANNKLSIPDLKFENMTISRETPYFDPGYMALTSDSLSAEMSGYTLTLKNIKTVNNSGEKGVHIDASIHLADMFSGQAGINIYGDGEKWKFKKLSLDKIDVKYNSQAFSLQGGVEFREGDDIYGKGFRGELSLEVAKLFKLDAVGVFGKVDGYRYFMTDAMYHVSPTNGLYIPPVLNFYGVGGGLYRHMQQSVSGTATEFGKSLTGINYTPDKNVGMGFMARTHFNLLKNSSLFDADVSFEMQFNNNWGVNFIQLRGDAKMLSTQEQQNSTLEALKRKFEKIEKMSDNKIEFDKTALDKKPEGNGALTATVGIKYDIENKVFNADMKAYLDVAGVLTGRGTDNCMGWASTYISIPEDKWYTHIGTPTNRLGVSLLGIADAGGYFMIGSEVPEMTIPNELKSKAGLSKYFDEIKDKRDTSILTDGSGMAFGADLSVEFDAKLIPFYAHLSVGMGTEMLLKKYSEAAHCKGMTGMIGIDGWYAQAQAYAWVDAAIGMKIKLFRKERRFDILSASMATYLKGAGPNPFYFSGVVGGKFKLLGGLVKGNCNFDFTVGEKCEIEGGSPFGEDIIAQLTPTDKSEEVNVFIAPQLVLNVPIDEAMEIEDEEGRKETYRISVEEFTITNQRTGVQAKYTMTKGEEGRILNYKTEEPLESQTDYKIYAKVLFERKEGDKWVAVMGEDAKPYSEEKLVEFKSGDRPKYIMPEHVVYAYPADRQYNFLSKEYDEAYVMTSENYSYLFTTDKPEGFDQRVQITSFDGQTQESSFTHKVITGKEGVRFEVSVPLQNVNLATDEIYNMSIVNVPQREVQIDENIFETEREIETAMSDSEVTSTKYTAEGDLEILKQTEIYAIDFRTSSYKTFEEKMAGMEIGDITAYKLYSNVYILKTSYIETNSNVEALDEYEYDIDNREDDLVVIEPIYSKIPWYTKYVAPLIYDNTDIESIIGEIAPPLSKDVVNIYTSNSEVRVTDNIQTTNGRLSLSRWHTINNNMQKYIDDDLSGYRTKVANGLTKGRVKTEGVSKFMLLNNIPETTYGEYPVVIKYIIPGRGITTSEIELNLYYKQNND